jgi:hypothetical protein
MSFQSKHNNKDIECFIDKKVKSINKNEKKQNII